jgi:hypothetical protein
LSVGHNKETMKVSQEKMIRLGMVLVGVVIVYAFFTSYSGMKSVVVDQASELGGSGQAAPASDTGPYQPSEDTKSLGGNAVAVSNMQGRTPSSTQTYTTSTLSADEMLPKGGLGASFGAVNPSSADDLDGQNFLQAGYASVTNVIGIAQTNRNASYDLRSEVPNPQTKVGPFLNTTIDPDPFKASRALEGLAS